MEYRRFEAEFLRIAFTTPIELTPSSLAYLLRVPVEQADQHMRRLVDLGVLELTSDDEGHLEYEMPDRPDRPILRDDAPPPYPELPPLAPPRAIVVRSSGSRAMTPITRNQATASMFLNAMVCPGVGSLVGGKTRAGIAQLSLFLVGIPLVVVAIGLPLIVASWTWGVATGAQLIAEAQTT